jgi:hypothetical protein
VSRRGITPGQAKPTGRGDPEISPAGYSPQQEENGAGTTSTEEGTPSEADTIAARCHRRRKVFADAIVRFASVIATNLIWRLASEASI